MNNFGKYLTPEEAKRTGDRNGDAHSLGWWKRLANKKARPCEVCEAEPEWLYGRTGMCFSCTTGEADASEDCEIAP